MWVCLNDGFVSAVQHKDAEHLLVVRARSRDHLVSIFGAGASISESAATDYRYRTIVSKDEFARIVSERIAKIDYGNFKNSVKEDDLHDLYADFWQLHWRYQNKKLDDQRLAMLRPSNYDSLSLDKQWEVDKQLGLLDYWPKGA